MSFLARPAHNGALASLSVVDRTSAEDQGDGEARIGYVPDGTLWRFNFADETWATEGGPYAQGALWIRLSGVTGSGGAFSGPSVDTWHQMSTNREWALSNSSTTTDASRSGTISIATAADDGSVVETHSFFLLARKVL